MTGAATGRPLWAPFVLLAAAIVVSDQVAKAWITDALAPDGVLNLVGDNLRLVYTQNSGALFGLFRGQAAPFAILSLVVIGLIVAYHGRSGRSPYMTLTLGLLLGGAIGNAIDRFNWGAVADFINVSCCGIHNPWSFNVADIAIFMGFGLLLLPMFRRPGSEAPSAPS